MIEIAKIIHYGSPKTYPYYIKYADGRVSGVFSKKKRAKAYLENEFLGLGKGKIIDRRKKR